MPRPIKAAVARALIRMARRCGASTDEIFAEFRCPACGSLDPCACATPGALCYPSTPYADLLRQLKEHRHATPPTTSTHPPGREA